MPLLAVGPFQMLGDAVPCGHFIGLADGSSRMQAWRDVLRTALRLLSPTKEESVCVSLLEHSPGRVLDCRYTRCETAQADKTNRGPGWSTYAVRRCVVRATEILQEVARRS